MNLTMAITLDGLVRALRWKAHDLAEGVEEGYVGGGSPVARDLPSHPEATSRQAGGAGDELGGS